MSSQEYQHAPDADRAARMPEERLDRQIRFPYVESYRYENHKVSTKSLHSHPFLELLYQCTGTVSEFSLDGKPYRLRRGDVAIIPAGVEHGFLPGEQPERFEGYIIWIGSEFESMLVRNFPSLGHPKVDRGLVLRTADTMWEYLEKLFLVNVQEQELQDLCWEAAVVGNTINLLTSLSRVMASVSLIAPAGRQPELLDRIVGYVNMMLSEKITLKGTADFFQVSQSTITNLFNREMGMSFYHFLTGRRLEEARKLMDEGVPMERIAAKVGFADYSTFYRAFKRAYSVSPAQYRKQGEG